MSTTFENVLPEEIERRSFAIIESELPHPLDERYAPIIKRVIHTSADFDYADALVFTPDALERGLGALRRGADIVTDTNMAKAGISAALLKKFGGRVHCFMADEDIAAAAKAAGSTRAAASMRKAASLPGELIFAIGNAPTALATLCALCEAGLCSPALVIGAPVGFVNVVPAKELLLASGLPAIVARGRKGGSNVAAAICNALLRMA